MVSNDAAPRVDRIEARDLGPRVAHAILPIKGKGDSDWSYSWIPIVGPLIGGVVAGVLANIVNFV